MKWVSLAGGLVDADERIVRITTGNIMKDPRGCGCLRKATRGGC